MRGSPPSILTNKPVRHQKRKNWERTYCVIKKEETVRFFLPLVAHDKYYYYYIVSHATTVLGLCMEFVWGSTSEYVGNGE